MTIHRCPVDASGLMPCCNRTPFEVSHSDILTEDPKLVSCTGRPAPLELDPVEYDYVEKPIDWRKEINNFLNLWKNEPIVLITAFVAVSLGVIWLFWFIVSVLIDLVKIS